jgi:metal-responsive CopG/Arc/MetJ family transcriptional regulator
MESIMRHKARAVFVISKSLKEEFEEVVPLNKRSQFVEQAIADALLKEAKRKALASLDELPTHNTQSRDSVEFLRQLRADGADNIVSRHQTTDR